MEYQKSIKEIIETEASSYTKPFYPIFKSVMSEEGMQDYIITFFYTCLSKLMSEKRIEVSGVWYDKDYEERADERCSCIPGRWNSYCKIHGLTQEEMG